MYIDTLYRPDKIVLSFEVFPPQQDAPLHSLFPTLKQLYRLHPDFISVTYGAGGSTQSRTVEIAAQIVQSGNTALAHLTCVGATASQIDGLLLELEQQGVQNVLALRGDPPSGQAPEAVRHAFPYAQHLVRHIKTHTDFCVGTAAYPEGHPQSASIGDDIRYLKEKVDAGANFLITQLFFNNEDFFEFKDRVIQAGITVPISVGVMPVLAAGQILRMVRMCGCSIPTALSKIIARYGDSEDFSKAGKDYCIRQLDELVSAGVDGIHLYTMNKWENIQSIIQNSALKTLLRGDKILC